MKDQDDLIKLARDRMAEAEEADRDNRELALDDLENLSGDGQWPESVRTERESDGRPCLTINRLPQFVRQVTGDLRRLNPAINVSPGDNRASKDVAEVYEGLIRQIEYESDASSVYEQAAESAAQCGMGFFRVRADWESDTSFVQKINIERVSNPFSVYFDPAAKLPTREDADYVFVTEQMRIEDFQAQFPDKTPVDAAHDGTTDGMEHWYSSGGVIVAEYIWKEYEEVELSLLADGSVVEETVAPQAVLRTRKAVKTRVMWAKISGKEILEEPKELPCKYLPIVAVIGEEMQVGEQVVRTSVIRYAKDPQRTYNYWRSAQTELVALQPKAPYLVTPQQIEGFEDMWAAANNSNEPYLMYHPDDQMGPPQRSTPPVSSQGMMQEVMSAAEDMKATTGIYDAGLGHQSNEKSGVAIRQRQMESDVSTSIYSDNLAKAIQLCGRILVSMIPRVYDTPRMVSILGKDETPKIVEINSPMMTAEGQMIQNDMAGGRYNVRVSVGPNYSTRRQETAESMMDFMRAYPAAGPVIADLVASNMDWPGADQLAERLKKMLPPGMIEPDKMSPEQQQQMQIAGQKAQQQEAMAQAMAQAEMQKTQAEVQKTQGEAMEAQADAKKANVEAAREAMQMAMDSGQLNDTINQIVQQAVTAALAQQQRAFMGYPPA